MEERPAHPTNNSPLPVFNSLFGHFTFAEYFTVSRVLSAWACAMACNNVHSLARKLNFIVRTLNGVRKYGPNRLLLDVNPMNGSELLVGRIPMDALEDELYPFFASAGDVYQIELLLNVDSSTKGVCIVKYMTPKDAIKAARILCSKKFRDTHCLLITHVIHFKEGWHITEITDQVTIWIYLLIVYLVMCAFNCIKYCLFRKITISFHKQ